MDIWNLISDPTGIRTETTDFKSSTSTNQSKIKNAIFLCTTIKNYRFLYQQAKSLRKNRYFDNHSSLLIILR